MPKDVKCPYDEKITISYPDSEEWTMGHMDKWHKGTQQAPDGCAPATEEIYGAIALCDEIKGIESKDLSNTPMKHLKVFKWLVKTVYVEGYLEALDIKNW